jgi:branched-chain amino acid transport system permease protein
MNALSSRTVRIVGGIALAYLLLYWVPGSPLPDWMPWGVVTQGVIFGSSNALLAMGLILVYRTSRIVNFAYGALGAVAGAFTVGLYMGRGWNYWVALLVGLAIGTAFGALTDVVVLRRFDRSSRLVATVATLGLAQLFGALALGTIFALGVSGFVGNIETPIDASFRVRPYLIRGDHLLMLGLVPVAVAGLGWFLFRTDAGRAVRAAADDADRAKLLGIPVGRLRTLVGAIAGALSTATYITKVPFTGVVPEASVSATAILPGLAIAVVARFQSLPTALAAGIGLGIAEWTIRWNTSADSAFTIVFLVVILVALLTQKNVMSRAESAGSAWEGAVALRPLSAAVRANPRVRQAAIGIYVVGGLFLGYLIATAASSTLLTFSYAATWAMVGLSLVVLAGWGGVVSLGQFAIVGVGATVAGNVLMRTNADVFLAVLAAGAAGALVSALIGIPALRIAGFGLAVATISFAVSLDAYFLNPVNFPDWVPDDVIRPVLFKRFDLEDERALALFSLTFLLLAVAVVRSLRRTRPGRNVIAARDNVRFAGALGVPTTLTRIQSFVLAGAIAGTAGGVYMVIAKSAGQATFRPEMSIELFSYAAIGGLASPAGAILGIAGFRAIDFILSQQDWLDPEDAAIIRLSLSGAGLLFVLYLLPGGLWQGVQRLRDLALRAIGVHDDAGRPDLQPGEQGDDEDAPADEVGAIAAALSDPDPDAEADRETVGV